MLENNPLYKQCYNDNGITLYMPDTLTSYHKSREIAMQAQERYSKGGISKEVLQAMATKAIELCNKGTLDNIRTDMAIIWGNIQARMADPVDELCAIRMGAIATFMENEDPDKVEMAWTNKKLRLAEQYPDLYAFFLNTGIAFTPEYSSLLRGLNVEDYLNNRAEMLKYLTLPSTPSSE